MELKPVKVNKKVRNDAEAVCGSIYRMNAKNAIAYAFNIHDNGKEVFAGEFINFMRELEEGRYSFVLDFTNNNYYRVVKDMEEEWEETGS